MKGKLGTLQTPPMQCDQIEQFFCTLANFKASGNNYFTQIAHMFGNFCKGAKIIHFSSEIIFGQLL